MTFFAGDWRMLAVTCDVALAVGYLLGATPFGLLIARAAGAGDIRKIGSGNIGATNVLRTGKRWAAALTLLGDAGKGTVAVLFAQGFGGDWAAAFAALGAFLGHLFPFWLDFRGGKGVATFIGVTFALSWPVGLMTCATWLGAAVLWRTSSLAALLAAAATPIYLAFWDKYLFAVLAFVLAALIFVTHRENINRLSKGAEPKIGAKTGSTL